MNTVNNIDVASLAVHLDMSEEDLMKKLKEIMGFFQKEGMSRKFNTVLGYLTGRSDLMLKIIIGSGSYTDNRLVVVGISEDYWKLTMEEIYLLSWALNIHELFHTLSSNFIQFSAYMREQTDRLVKEGLPRGFAQQMVHSVANILEDGRIERIAGRYLPGIVKNLQFLNIFHWKEGAVTEDADEISTLMNNMLTHAKLGIYPKDYALYALDSEADEQFEKIRHLIPKGVTARTHADGLAVCVEVLDELLPFLKAQYETMKDEQEQMEKLKELLEKLIDSSNYNNSEESHTNDGTGQGSPVHLSAPPKQNPGGPSQGAGKKEGEEEGEGAGKAESEKDADSTAKGKKDGENGEKPSEEGEGKSKGKGEDSEEAGSFSSGREESLGEGQETSIEDMLERLRKELMEEAKEGMAEVERLDQKHREAAERSNEAAFKMQDARKELGEDFTEHPMPSQPTYDIPQEVKLRAVRFKKDVIKIMKSKSRTMLSGQKKGVLYDDDLYRIALKDYSIFSVEGAKSHSDHVFYILQDGSGSMMGEKEQNSAYALSIIEEGLKGVVPFKVTTFSAGYGGIQHYVVKPWNGKSKKNYSFSFLKNRSATGGNEDDVSIRIATAELKARAEKDKVLIVLSDGLPSSMPRTSEAIKAARKEGIHVVGIMFGDEHFRRTHYEAYRNMYEKNIISTSPHGIHMKLAETLKQILGR